MEDGRLRPGVGGLRADRPAAARSCCSGLGDYEGVDAAWYAVALFLVVVGGAVPVGVPGDLPARGCCRRASARGRTTRPGAGRSSSAGPACGAWSRSPSPSPSRSPWTTGTRPSRTATSSSSSPSRPSSAPSCVQGLTLPPLIRLLKLPGRDPQAATLAEANAQAQASRVAEERLDALLADERNALPATSRRPAAQRPGAPPQRRLGAARAGQPGHRGDRRRHLPAAVAGDDQRRARQPPVGVVDGLAGDRVDLRRAAPRRRCGGAPGPLRSRSASGGGRALRSSASRSSRRSSATREACACALASASVSACGSRRGEPQQRGSAAAG